MCFGRYQEDVAPSTMIIKLDWILIYEEVHWLTDVYKQKIKKHGPYKSNDWFVYKFTYIGVNQATKTAELPINQRLQSFYPYLWIITHKTVKENRGTYHNNEYAHLVFTSIFYTPNKIRNEIDGKRRSRCDFNIYIIINIYKHYWEYGIVSYIQLMVLLK